MSELSAYESLLTNAWAEMSKAMRLGDSVGFREAKAKYAKQIDRLVTAKLAAKVDKLTHELDLAQLQIDEDKGNINDLVKGSAGMTKRIKELKGALSRLLKTHTFYTEHDKIAVDGIKDVLKGEPVDNKKDMAMPSPEYNALRNQADQLGWSYIRINADGKLVGLPPPPANNQDLIEITAAVLEG